MRSERRKDLLHVLRQGHATSQQEIVAALREKGHDVTQATVSRDLRELGAIKVRSGETLTYRLPDDVPHGNGDLTTRRLLGALREFAVDIRPAGSLVVVMTAPGHAAAVARAVDHAALPEVIGTVAGDDTIFVAAPSAEAAAQLASSWLAEESDLVGAPR
ncbi:MAG: arginine repressor [Actinomycetota bacterium]